MCSQDYSAVAMIQECDLVGADSTRFDGPRIWLPRLFSHVLFQLTPPVQLQSIAKLKGFLKAASWQEDLAMGECYVKLQSLCIVIDNDVLKVA